MDGLGDVDPDRAIMTAVQGAEIAELSNGDGEQLYGQEEEGRC